MELSSKTRKFYSDIIVTAIENPYHRGWDEQLVEYKWYSPTLDGGSAEPGPDGSANAYAVFYRGDMETELVYLFDVEAVEKAREVMRKVAETDSRDARRARHLESGMVLGDDWDYDALDALDIMQFFMFGETVYG